MSHACMVWDLVSPWRLNKSSFETPFQNARGFAHTHMDLFIKHAVVGCYIKSCV